MVFFIAAAILACAIMVSCVAFYNHVLTVQENPRTNCHLRNVHCFMLSSKELQVRSVFTYRRIFHVQLPKTPRPKGDLDIGEFASLDRLETEGVLARIGNVEETVWKC